MENIILILDIISILVLLILAAGTFFMGFAFKDVLKEYPFESKSSQMGIYLKERIKAANEYHHLNTWQNKVYIIVFFLLGIYLAIAGNLIILILSILCAAGRHFSLVFAQAVRDITKPIKN